MTDHQVATTIRRAQKAAYSLPFLTTRVSTVVSAVLTPLMLASELGVGMGAGVAALAWGTTYLFWVDAKDRTRGFAKRRAQLLWEQIGGRDSSRMTNPAQMRGIAEQIAQVYKHDPQGEVFPLSQAVRLFWAWQQQQMRLVIIEHRVNQMKDLRSTLREKQRLLHELGDDNAVVEKTLDRLDGDIGPLERSSETLRASRDRLEVLVASADAAVRRRQLHREIGELAAQIPEGESSKQPLFNIEEEHFDIERQISREIETFLQLERETDTHLRDL